MCREQRSGTIAVAFISLLRTRLPFIDQLLPDLRGRIRGIARARHEGYAVGIGFFFLRAAHLKHRHRDQGVDALGRIDPVTPAAGTDGVHARTDVGDRPYPGHGRGGVSQTAITFDRMLAVVVSRFVAQHRRQLRFVAHARHQPGIHDHHSRREHRRVEERTAHQIDAQVRRLAPHQALDDAARVALQIGSVQQLRRGLNGFFDLLHALPHAPFVGIDWFVVDIDQWRQVGGQHVCACEARHAGGTSAGSQHELSS